MEKDRPLPKFGDWDVSNPSSAEGYTVIFNNARKARAAGDNNQGGESPGREGATHKQDAQPVKPESKKGCCCFGGSPTQP